MNDLKIYVATHKNYQMPSEKMYIPIFLGSAIKKSNTKYQKDNVGENISEKNPFFSELTCLYWIWKNTNHDYIGLVHYRRHFSLVKKKDRYDSILKEEEIRPLLKANRIIVPKARKFYIESLASHYAHSHYAEHLDFTREIIEDICPNYLQSFDYTMKQTKGYMFNMMILPQKKLNAYCSWLFLILFELEKRIDATKYTPYQARLFGRISELLLNVWIHKNDLEIVELPWIYLEKINKTKKIKSFLEAKFFGKKYDGSF